MNARGILNSLSYDTMFFQLSFKISVLQACFCWYNTRFILGHNNVKQNHQEIDNNFCLFLAQLSFWNRLAMNARGILNF